MSELDVLKEKIAHMKLWLGIFVVTDISLVGWFAANYTKAEFLLLLLDSAAILVVSVLIWVFNRKIEAYINQLRDL